LMDIGKEAEVFLRAVRDGYLRDGYGP